MTLTRMILRSLPVAGLAAATLAAGLGGTADAAPHKPGSSLGWKLTDTGVQSRFRGLAAVDRNTAWAAGSGGTVLRTVNGGRTWAKVAPADAAGLEFRDVEAFDADNAVVLAIGEGDASRVYRTSNGGRTWTTGFTNGDPNAFYDCMTFFDRKNGLAVSDPVDGKFRILATGDGGRSWKVLPNAGMPAALPGEAAFAASGQCLVSHGARDAWIATGGGASSRVFHSRDRGRTWTVTNAPLPSGAAAGVFGLAFRDARHGVAVGGDYRPGEASPKAAATTGDAGRSWRLAPRPPAEYRSGVTYVGPLLLAVGPTGSDVSRDNGRTWKRFDTGSFDTVSCAHGGCWASGEKGRIARMG